MAKLLRPALLVLATLLAIPAHAQAPAVAPLHPQTPQEVAKSCRRVGDAISRDGRPGFLRIDPAAAAQLAEIGLDRAAMFEQMGETSIPETVGCWAMPVGNFDSQLVSVGMSQWNYGTGSLQPILKAWRRQFRSGRDYRRAMKQLAPVYGRSLIFSRDCLKVPAGERCRAGVLAAHDPDGRLNPVIFAELTRIFESDEMLQVQTDHYVDLLLAVRTDLLRVFAGQPITRRKVRWAVDTKVQQGSFPLDEDLARLRGKLAAMPEAERWDRLRAILDWYRSLGRTIDQDGVQRDFEWNYAQWNCMIDTGQVDPEQYEMLHLTFLRSRTAIGNSGRWQALTFSRRAKIVMGVGSVSGRRDGECRAITPAPVSLQSE
jgi:hypothetical protein